MSLAKPSLCFVVSYADHCLLQYRKGEVKHLRFQAKAAVMKDICGPLYSHTDPVRLPSGVCLVNSGAARWKAGGPKDKLEDLIFELKRRGVYRQETLMTESQRGFKNPTFEEQIKVS